jgi:protein-S-isoprenylcysteine O-methyltransferase Ste14
MTPYLASWALLAVFLVSWVGAAAWAGRTVATSTPRELLPLYSGGALFLLAMGAAAAFDPALRVRLWPASPGFDWAMLALCAMGLVGCWWARLHIGRLWSGGVVVKEGHHVVDTGPYAIVRHPIYTCAFVAALPFTLIRARPLDLLLFAGFVSFFSLKARVEERFLSAQFGAAYEDYRSRVPMLIPGL